MSNTDDMDMRLDKVLAHLEAGQHISDGQLAELLADEALMDAVLEAKELQAGLQTSRHPVDVEARLQQFHQQHAMAPAASRPAKVLRLKPWLLTAIAAAAAIVGVIFLLSPSRQSSVANSTLSNDNPSSSIFTAEDLQAGLTLTNEQGESIALSPATRQNTSVSLADFRHVLSNAEAERVTLTVPFGKSTDITLPDGSVAYLHPGSRLKFPTTFDGPQRMVILEGEAYFKVKHDTEHPFVVVTDRLQTTVLGTEFNVSSERAEVTLISGSVNVAPTGGTPQRLQPGQQLCIMNSELCINKVDVTPFEYWRDGYLYYDNVPLRDIMEAIGKNFNITVEFRNEEALDVRMRFIAERNKGVDTAISMMNRMKKVRVSRNGHKIVVD